MDQIWNSRLPGYHTRCVRERIRLAGLEDIAMDLATGGLIPMHADSMIEDVVGVISYPLAIAPNFIVDGEDVLVPMAIEEPSVVAAAARGALAARELGGFVSSVSDPVSSAQILLVDGADGTEDTIRSHAQELLDGLRGRHPRLEQAGGGPVAIETRRLDRRRVVVLLHVDTRDALGANVVDDLAEALAPELERLTGAEAIGAIVTNGAPMRRVKVVARFPVSSLARGGYGPQEAAERFLEMARWAEADPMRAVTHNKGIMNGVVAVAMATAQDTRAIEAGAHFMASTGGAYRPLSMWKMEDGALVGELELPHAFATVGGALSKHPLARALLEHLGLKKAERLAAVAGAVGLACNFSALSVLATEGIQKGHMKLHRR